MLAGAETNRPYRFGHTGEGRYPEHPLNWTPASAGVTRFSCLVTDCIHGDKIPCGELLGRQADGFFDAALELGDHGKMLFRAREIDPHGIDREMGGAEFFPRPRLVDQFV